ncbi:TPA: hypothetical protein ACNIJL_003921 [Pseudomonas aeruginosa]
MKAVKKLGVVCAVLAVSAVLSLVVAHRLALAPILTNSPTSLSLLRHPCRAEQPIFGTAFCHEVGRADTQRFLSGRSGPDEYTNLADLPFIPASFDDVGDLSPVEEEVP